MNSRYQIIGAAGTVLAAALLSGVAWAAGPSDYVYVPSVTYGEHEIDFKAGTVKRSSEGRESAASLGYGYGVTDYWFSEVYAKYKHAPEGTAGFDAFEWENKFQLTQAGQYPVDIGFITEIERPKDRSEGYEVKFGPLFQTEFGKTQLNVNLLFQRNYRAAKNNSMKFGYQWQIKYRWRPELDFGAQGFGDAGELRHFAPRPEQSHVAGPAVFGKFALGNRHAIRYNAAYLIDLGDTPHNNTLRMQVEYEF
ncbi:MAG: hypothetical protein NVSMB6_06320 [Burkholderiaceae bacterium]